MRFLPISSLSSSNAIAFEISEVKISIGRAQNLKIEVKIIAMDDTSDQGYSHDVIYYFVCFTVDILFLLLVVG